MFDRLTDRARQVMGMSRQEAQRFRNDYIGTEHMLLGLIREKKGIAASVLEQYDVGLAEVREEVTKLLASDVGPAASSRRPVVFQRRAIKTVHLLGLDDPRLPDEQRVEVERVVNSLALTCVPENVAHVLIVFAPDFPGAAMYEIGIQVGERGVVLLLLPPDETVPAQIASCVQSIPLGANTGDMIRKALEAL